MRNYVLVLSSGGIDSTACINFYKKADFDVDCLFVDYGQLSNERELSSIKKIANHFKVEFKTVKILSHSKYQRGEVLGRNAFLIFTALMNFRKKNGLVALGLHKGTPYYDSSNKFIEEIQEIVDKYSKGTVKINVPFIEFNKKEIYDYCIMEKIPLAYTYSCESGKKQPCGECSTCKDLVEIYDNKK